MQTHSRMLLSLTILVLMHPVHSAGEGSHSGAASPSSQAASDPAGQDAAATPIRCDCHLKLSEEDYCDTEPFSFVEASKAGYHPSGPWTCPGNPVPVRELVDADPNWTTPEDCALSDLKFSRVVWTVPKSEEIMPGRVKEYYTCEYTAEK